MIGANFTFFKSEQDVCGQLKSNQYGLRDRLGIWRDKMKKSKTNITYDLIDGLHDRK